MDGEAEEARALPALTRRGFLGMGAGITAAALIPGCRTTDDQSGSAGLTSDDVTTDHPQTGLRVPEAGAVGRYLNPEQAGIVTAVVARLIPGDDDDPGAVQAGVVTYIDRLLSTHEGYADRTYTQGPFAQTYEGDAEPEPESGVIWVQADELSRYGWQSGFTPREIYRMGLARLDALAQQRDGSSFVDLDDDQQDALLRAVEDDEDDDVGELFEPMRAGPFFTLIHRHTIEGFLADPIYGGNQDLTGWRHIGFPGAQRGYAPSELLDPNFTREPQSLAGLAMFHADHGDDDALGSVRRRHPAGPID